MDVRKPPRLEKYRADGDPDRAKVDELWRISWGPPVEAYKIHPVRPANTGFNAPIMSLLLTGPLAYLVQTQEIR